ncbi:hypothetical protein OROMI_029815 [Orobanche minor]
MLLSDLRKWHFLSSCFFPALSTLTASICWNILADKTDELSDIGVKIYQKPEANDIYALRRKKVPPLCKDNENPDFAW